MCQFVAYGGPRPANHDWNGTAHALVIAPEPSIGSELRSLLEGELPFARVIALDRYPDRETLLELATRPGARLCLVDVVSQPRVAGGILAALGESAPRLPVIAVLHGNDPDLILQCLRQGASEFLIRPFTPAQFQAVLAKISQTQQAAAAASGRLLCGIPGKGASGTTTLVCNLAFALRRKTGGRILLADLDGLCGTVPFVLKLKSSYSFVDAMNHAGALDADVWNALVTPSHGIDVLLSPDSPLDGMAPPGDAGPILAYARQAYDLVIADCGAAYGAANLSVAASATDLLLVVTTELPAVHAAQRAIAHLENAGIGQDRLKLVVNRFRKNVGLGVEQVAQALGLEVFHVLPSNYEVVYKALLEGKPAAAGNPYGAAVAELAAKLVGEGKKAVQSASSRFSTLFARFRG